MCIACGHVSYVVSSYVRIQSARDLSYISMVNLTGVLLQVFSERRVAGIFLRQLELNEDN